MSAKLDALARDKEILLARSALCRLHLRREARSLRESLQWKRAAVAAVKSPAMRRFALGLAVSWVGLNRAVRVVAVAGWAVLFAKLALSIIGSVRQQADGDARLR